ncbi:hypothetical protein BTHI11S_03562 [Bosea thiooxidans]
MKVTGIEATLRTRYTADTLRALKRRCPGVNFVWIDGLGQSRRLPSLGRVADHCPEMPIAATDRAELDPRAPWPRRPRGREEPHRRGDGAAGGRASTACLADRGATRARSQRRKGRRSPARARQRARRPGPLDARLRREDREGDLGRQQGGRGRAPGDRAGDARAARAHDRPGLQGSGPARPEDCLRRRQGPAFPARRGITIAWFRGSGRRRGHDSRNFTRDPPQRPSFGAFGRLGGLCRSLPLLRATLDPERRRGILHIACRHAADRCRAQSVRPGGGAGCDDGRNIGSCRDDGGDGEPGSRSSISNSGKTASRSIRRRGGRNRKAKRFADDAQGFPRSRRRHHGRGPDRTGHPDAVAQLDQRRGRLGRGLPQPKSVRRHLREDPDRLCRQAGRAEADRGRHQRHGLVARPAFELSRTPRPSATWIPTCAASSVASASR